MTMRVGVLGALAVWALAFSACGDDEKAESRVTRAFETGTAPHVVAETVNGTVQVRVVQRFQGVIATVVTKGWGKDDRRAREALQDVVVTTDQRGDTVRITAEHLDSKLNAGADLFLEVPAGASLELLSTNDCIHVENVQGGLVARTTNGSISLEGVSGVVEATTTNGDVHAIVAGAVVQLTTTNGEVGLEGPLGVGRHTVQTTNGDLNVTLPGDSTFEVDAHTTNGRVSTSFPVSGSLRSQGSTLSGTVGDNPEVFLSLVTTNGSISLDSAGR
jgi:DUF4097 and DUF4098 domain-containing protein YvlB